MSFAGMSGPFGGGNGPFGGGQGMIGGGQGLFGGGQGIFGGGSGGGSGGVDYAYGSGALTTSRDGIVGDWNPPNAGEHPANHEPDDLEVFSRWEPWVRAQVFDQILLQPLSVVTGPDKKTATTTLWHREPIAPDTLKAPAVEPRLLFSMSRPTDEQFRMQLHWLDHWADLRVDRAAEILAQIPEMLTFFGTVVWLRPDRMRWTLELLSAFYRATLAIEMRFKAAMACRRPTEFSAQVQPMIETPGHSAYPSGHAMESHCFAFVLACLVKYREQNAGWPAAVGGTPSPADQAIEQLRRLAARITINRTVAGVHFPVDSTAGARLGMTLARYFVARAKSGGHGAWLEGLESEYHPPEFKDERGPDFEGIPVAAWKEKVKEQADKATEGPEDWTADAPLGWLWQHAEEEWR